MYKIPDKLPNGELVIKLDNWTIRGKSTGGLETAITIEELSVIFDVGYQADKLEAIQNVLISHGHMDHIGCLHMCYASKQLHKIITPWQIILPQNCYEPFRTITTAMSSLGRGGYPIEFYDCKFNDSVECKVLKPFERLRVNNIAMAEDCKHLPLINKANFVVNAYKMNHKITSFGYVISEKRNKLKQQYLGLPGIELKKLKASEIEITDEIKIPMIAFTGDTQIDAILNNDEFLNATILLMECTHFEFDTTSNSCVEVQDAAFARRVNHGHVHFKQILENINKFKNKFIVLCHFSQKYRKLSDVDHYLKLLTPEDQQRIVVWIT